MALCLHTLGQAGPLISAQGYINDVSTVATIHHAEKLRDASLPVRDPSCWSVYMSVCICVSKCIRKNAKM